MKLQYKLFFYALFSAVVICPFSYAAEKGIIIHSGMCDASAAIAIDSTLFIVANDEDNILRIYRNDMSAAPIQSYDLNPFLHPDIKHPEADIEGAAKIGSRIFWITSHGRNKKGKVRTSRYRLFATDIKSDRKNITVTPVGLPYTHLIKDLLTAPQLKELGLDAAAKKPPKDYGALNIEGLSATPDGKLLIAFRNPIPSGKAVIVPLENPQDVIMGKTALFGNPMKLPLDNLGIRSIEYFPPQKKYMIVAGPYNGNGVSKLFEWSGIASDNPTLIKKVSFAGLNPEALIVYSSKKSEIHILSDDGTREINGNECKKVRIELRNFRSSWFSL